MMVSRALLLSLSIVAVAASAASAAMAQACTRQGADVSCDDGRRGIFAGDDGAADSVAASLGQCRHSVSLKRFPAKWVPVRVKKTRQDKKARASVLIKLEPKL